MATDIEHNPIDDLIEGWYNGSLSQAQAAQLNEELLNNPELQETFLREGIIQGTLCEWAQHEVEEAENTPTTPRESAGSQKRIVRFPLPALAAIAAMLLLVVSLTVYSLSSSPVHVTVHQQPNTPINVSTSKHETKTLIMTHGATLALSANTVISLNENETNHCRLVNGSVVVSVPPQNPNRRFVIHTADMSVTVLGTKFSLTQSSRGSRVDVIKGLVEVAPNNQPSQKISAGNYLAVSRLAPRKQINIRLTATKDTTLEEEHPDASIGHEHILRVDARDPNDVTEKKPLRYDVRALLQWDLSSLPAGFTIESATLNISAFNTMGRGEDPFFYLYALKNPWEEKAATWRHRDATHRWDQDGANTPGLDYVSVPLAKIYIKGKGRHTIALNKQGIKQLQAWQRSPKSNHGVLITGPSPDGLDFFSREHKDKSTHPVLEIIGTEAQESKISTGSID